MGRKWEWEEVAQACVSGFCVKDGRGMEWRPLGPWDEYPTMGI